VHHYFNLNMSFVKSEVLPTNQKFLQSFVDTWSLFLVKMKIK
jgi:hypothetical protein